MRPSAPTPTFGAVVADFLESRRWRKVSAHYLANLGYALRRAARELPASMSAWQPSDVEAHLRAIPEAGPRTRNNVLGVLRQVARYAQRRGHLARDWLALDAVDRELVPLRFEQTFPEEHDEENDDGPE